MKKFIALLSLIVIAASCGSDNNDSGLMTINGNIDGLKMGRVLLQKVEDTVLVTLDSVSLDGKSDFELQTNLSEPELMFIHLDVRDGAEFDDRISFFAEDTVLTLNSTLENFEKGTVISGSKNNDILQEFNKNKVKLTEVYTELVKRSIIIDQAENPDPEELEKLDKDYSKYLRKKVLYAINYSNRFPDKEVAPYILITEAFDANPVLLDSSFQNMTKKIQSSRYGKQLSELIKTSKENDL